MLLSLIFKLFIVVFFLLIFKGIRYIEVVNDPFYYEWYLAYNRQSKK